MRVKIIPHDSPDVPADLITSYEVIQVPNRLDFIRWEHNLDEHDEKDCTMKMKGIVDHVSWDFTSDEVELYVTQIEIEGSDVHTDKP